MSPGKYPDMIFAPRDLSIALADGLVARGHDVWFFTAPDVPTKAHLVPGDASLLSMEYYEEKLKNHPGERAKWASFYATKRNYEMDLTERCYKMVHKAQLDIIHSYHDSLAHFFDDLTNIPTVYTLHDPLPKDPKSVMYWLLQKYSYHNYISISDAFRHHESLKLHFAGTIHHGIDAEKYPYAGPGGVDGHILAMGRMVPEKGFDHAIKASLDAGVGLHIMTSDMEENSRLAYFTDHIVPLTQGVESIRYTGFLSGTEKASEIGSAKALIFPIRWEEPFGMVMIESMACGTPVIAYNRGSVPEIITDGKTGFIIDPPDGDDTPHPLGEHMIKKRGVEGLVEAITRIGEIDRAACRQRVMDEFSVEKMAEHHEQIYHKILAG